MSGSAAGDEMDLKTDLKIQHRIPCTTARDDEYEPVTCYAWTRLHFVNRKMGKLLGRSKAASIGGLFHG